MLYRKNILLTASLALALALFLSSCDNDSEKKIDTVENKTPSADNSIVLSADGIGPINATTSFNMHQINAAFINFNVVEEVNYANGTPLTSIRISEGVNTIMKIIPDASRKGIYSVMIEDNTVKNSLGHALGTPYSVVYPYGQNEDCQVGADEYANKVLCYAPQYPNILYVFNGPWNNAIAGKAPPADILQGWALESIIWRPKS